MAQSEKLKFGIYLPTFSKTLEARELYEYNLKVTKLVEDVGMDSVWAVDHLHAFDTVEKVEKSLNILESTTTLSALAAQTRRVYIGTSVLSAPFRNPALLAKIAATIDIISNGRLILGIGAGWRKDEFEGYGFKWEDTTTRLRRTAEAIEVIKKFWALSVVNHKGEFYSMKGGQLWPKPIQKPRPKIWFGGVGYKAIELAKYSDGWLAPPLNAEDLRERLEKFKEWGINLKSFDVGYELFTSISLSREEAYEQGKSVLEKWFGDPIDRIVTYNTEVQLPHGMKVRYGAIVGNVEDCIEGVTKFVKAGVRHFVLHFMPLENSHEGIKIYSEKVIPVVKEQVS